MELIEYELRKRKIVVKPKVAKAGTTRNMLHGLVPQKMSLDVSGDGKIDEGDTAALAAMLFSTPAQKAKGEDKAAATALSMFGKPSAGKGLAAGKSKWRVAAQAATGMGLIRTLMAGVGADGDEDSPFSPRGEAEPVAE